METRFRRLDLVSVELRPRYKCKRKLTSSFALDLDLVLLRGVGKISLACDMQTLVLHRCHLVPSLSKVVPANQDITVL